MLADSLPPGRKKERTRWLPGKKFCPEASESERVRLNPDALDTIWHQAACPEEHQLCKKVIHFRLGGYSGQMMLEQELCMQTRCLPVD